MSDDSDVGSDMGELEFQVEKILEKRLTNGAVEYYVKWKDFGEEDNTWEQEEGLQESCAEMIAKFERELKKKEAAKRGSSSSSTSATKKPAPSTSSSKSNGVRVSERNVNAAGKNKTEKPSATTASSTRVSSTITSEAEASPFDQGYEPERIIGATDSSGELQFLMKWKDVEETDFVMAEEANVKCPQEVIAFYESRIDWFLKDDDEEDGNNDNDDE